MLSVPIDSEGVDVQAMENIVREEKSKGSWNVTEEKPFWAMFYTIPVFHNPTGVTLPKGERLVISNITVVLNNCLIHNAVMLTSILLRGFHVVCSGVANMHCHRKNKTIQMVKYKTDVNYRPSKDTLKPQKIQRTVVNLYLFLESKLLK
jgi:hypothetical protein